MSFIIGEIFLCLLIATLLGMLLGWLLRGSCDKRIELCEDAWKAKMSSSDNALSDTSTNENVALKHNISDSDYSYERDLSERLRTAQEKTSQDEHKDIKINRAVGSTDNLDLTKKNLLNKGISLSDSRIKLYKDHGIDLDNAVNIEDHYSLKSFDWLSKKHIRKLGDLDIKTSKDVLKKLYKNREAMDKISHDLKIQPSDISSMVSVSDLIRVPGVESKIARLLQTVGISSVMELGITNASSLHSEMLSFNNKTKILDEVPSLSSISTWTKIAKSLG